VALGKLPDTAGGEDEDDGGIFAEINITPLTDVFLVLLIIFMVSALAVQVGASKQQKVIKEITQKQKQAEDAEKSGIKINLPQGQAQELDSKAESLVLMVPITGDVTVGGRAMLDPDLDNVFRAAFAKNKNTQVVLKADKGVAHGKVVNLMERAKQAGLTHLAIGTSGG
jgi:biopolymer transport protein ExbD